MGLPREQVAGEKRVEEILDILDQKYRVDVEKEKNTCLDEFLSMEREKEESV